MIANSRICDNCGSNHKSKPYTVYADGYHCFSCGYHKSTARGFIEAQSNPLINTIGDVITNYNDFQSINRQWLATYYIYEDDVYKYNVIEQNGALVFVHVVNNNIVMYQKRWLWPKRKIRNYGTRIPMLITNFVNSEILVLVEDPISCYRVSKQYNTLCLWGTSMRNSDIGLYARQFKHILIWLDPDAPGQNAAVKLQNKIITMQNKLKIHRAYSDDVYCCKIVKSKCDPKCYTDTEIKQIVSDL